VKKAANKLAHKSLYDSVAVSSTNTSGKKKIQHYLKSNLTVKAIK